MILLLKTFFWISSFLVIYPYIIYPMILWASRKAREPSRSQENNTHDSSTCPDKLDVTLIVSAFNEAPIIGEKIANALSLKYDGKLEIIVVSDGSTDGTAQIVREFAKDNPAVRLVELTEQSGKTAGLNKAVPMASGDLIVFTDANAMFEPTALEELVKPFGDPAVGYTVGSALYREEDEAAVNVSEGIYWRYELAIKKLESSFYSVVGGDGAIYCIRKSLFQPLTAIDISDFVNPLQIVAAGYRGRFVETARSFEGGTNEFADEFRRKRRIVNRSWSAVVRHIHLFSLSSHVRFLFLLFSHKVIRWWSLFFVLVALVSSLILASVTLDLLYVSSFIAIAGSLLTACCGWLLDRLDIAMPKLIYLNYYFYLVALAGLLGIFDAFRGRHYAIWKPLR